MGEQLLCLINGYSDKPNTKDCAHMRRSGDTTGVTVHFISNITLQTKKEELLSNEQNKQILWLVVSYTGTHRVRDLYGKKICRCPYCTNSITISSWTSSCYNRGRIQIWWCFSYIMQRTSGIMCSLNLNLNGWFRREIDAGTSLQCEPTSTVYGVGKKLSIRFSIRPRFS